MKRKIKRKKPPFKNEGREFSVLGADRHRWRDVSRFHKGNQEETSDGRRAFEERVPLPKERRDCSLRSPEAFEGNSLDRTVEHFPSAPKTKKEKEYLPNSDSFSERRKKRTLSLPTIKPCDLNVGLRREVCTNGTSPKSLARFFECRVTLVGHPCPTSSLLLVPSCVPSRRCAVNLF